MQLRRPPSACARPARSTPADHLAVLDAEIVEFVASLEARFGPTVLGMLMRGAVDPDAAATPARVPHESLGSASHRYALDQIAEAALEYDSMRERRNRLAAEADPTAVTDSEAFERFAKRWRARQTWRDRLMLASIHSV
jgi:FtsZ-binding cell division protein ZapB